MKNLSQVHFSLALFILITTFSQTFSITKTTISNGNWYDPGIWNPSGVPNSEDTIIVNHKIIFNDSILIMPSTSYFNIAPGAEINGGTGLDKLIVASDRFKNEGKVHVMRFAENTSSTLNYGLIIADTAYEDHSISSSNYGTIMSNVFGHENTFTNKPGGEMNIYSSFAIGDIFYNDSSGVIVTSTFTSGANFWNNGDISASDWTHGSGTATGTTGRFCIDMCFINNSTITGTVDICDATPGFICDLNMGSIAGTVTYCANGTCTSVGDVSEEIGPDIIIYPNPCTDFFQIEVPGAGTMAGLDFSILDLTGRQVTHVKIGNSVTRISVENLPRGMYIYKITGEEISEKTDRILVR